MALVLFGVLTVQRRTSVSRPLFAVGTALSLLAVVGVAIGVGGSEIGTAIVDAGKKMSVDINTAGQLHTPLSKTQAPL